MPKPALNKIGNHAARYRRNMSCLAAVCGSRVQTVGWGEAMIELLRVNLLGGVVDHATHRRPSRGEYSRNVRAEVQGKVDYASALAPDRLEDTLTDAVFSSLRYLPRQVVLRQLLRAVLPGITPTDSDLDGAEIIFWPTMPSVLWPGRSVEPDVVVVVGRHVVVFEAKYESGFSGYYLDGQRLHQLAVQCRAGLTWAATRRASSVTVVAVTADAAPPASLAEAREQLAVTVPDLPPVERQGAIRWLPWRAFAAIFRQMRGLAPHETAVRDDVLALMDRRGVSRVFEGFNAEDYWLVTAAQRVAVRRLYPAISTFVVELTGLLHDDGIPWGWPYKGLWATSGLGWTRPQDWPRDFLAAPFWPQDWPERTKSSDAIALYVLFDFINPAVEVGYVQSPPNTAAAQQKWHPHYPALADQLAQVTGEYSVAVDAGDWTTPAAEAPVAEADAQWFTGLGPITHLRVRRRLDFITVTTTEVVREVVRDVRRGVEGCPALHAMLRDTKQLVTAPESGATPTSEIPEPFDSPVNGVV